MIINHYCFVNESKFLTSSRVVEAVHIFSTWSLQHIIQSDPVSIEHARRPPLSFFNIVKKCLYYLKKKKKVHFNIVYLSGVPTLTFNFPCLTRTTNIPYFHEVHNIITNSPIIRLVKCNSIRTDKNISGALVR